MNNTNQQLYTIYKNIQRFYYYRKLVSLDDELSQDRFIKRIQKHKYMVLSAIDRALVSASNGTIDELLLREYKAHADSYDEKLKRDVKTLSEVDSDSDTSKTKFVKLTNILLVYPGTECETKRANMVKLINHIRFPRSEVFIITPTKISSGVAKGLCALATLKEHRHHEVRSFTYTLLSSVIPEHDLAPTYKNLNGSEIAKLQTWFSEPDSLPKIYESDPQMVWIGAKVDDVVAFTYPSEITIEAVRYCKVIPSV